MVEEEEAGTSGKRVGDRLLGMVVVWKCQEEAYPEENSFGLQGSRMQVGRESNLYLELVELAWEEDSLGFELAALA